MAQMTRLTRRLGPFSWLGDISPSALQSARRFTVL